MGGDIIIFRGAEAGGSAFKVVSRIFFVLVLLGACCVFMFRLLVCFLFL